MTRAESNERMIFLQRQAITLLLDEIEVLRSKILELKDRIKYLEKTKGSPEWTEAG